MPKHVIVEAALVTASGALDAGDVAAELVTFTSALDTQQTGKIMSVMFIDFALQNAVTDIIFFSAAPTVAAINAAFAPTEGNLADFVGHVEIAAADYSSFGANAVATKYALNMPIQLPGTTLYAVVVTRGTPNYADTTGGRLHVGIEKD